MRRDVHGALDDDFGGAVRALASLLASFRRPPVRRAGRAVGTAGLLAGLLVVCVGESACTDAGSEKGTDGQAGGASSSGGSGGADQSADACVSLASGFGPRRSVFSLGEQGAMPWKTLDLDSDGDNDMVAVGATSISAVLNDGSGTMYLQSNLAIEPSGALQSYPGRDDLALLCERIPGTLNGSTVKVVDLASVSVVANCDSFPPTVQCGSVVGSWQDLSPEVDLDRDAAPEQLVIVKDLVVDNNRVSLGLAELNSSQLCPDFRGIATVGSTEEVTRLIGPYSTTESALTTLFVFGFSGSAHLKVSEGDWDGQDGAEAVAQNSPPFDVSELGPCIRAELDGDGVNEWICSDTTYGVLTVYRASAAPWAATEFALPYAIYASQDLDCDGDEDAWGPSTILANSGHGQLGPGLELGLVEGMQCFVDPDGNCLSISSIEDMDGDGVLDLVGAVWRPGSAVGALGGEIVFGVGR